MALIVQVNFVRYKVARRLDFDLLEHVLRKLTANCCGS